MELTAEQIVTNLISSNELISPVKEYSKITNTRLNLGEYLTKLPKEEISEPVNETSTQNSRYTFIKGKWLF